MIQLGNPLQTCFDPCKIIFGLSAFFAVLGPQGVHVGDFLVKSTLIGPDFTNVFQQFKKTA
ncbi:hypothetical protein P872_20885 [Rhodonellum psychrophilum GCM71 = DSM 17998]|uniref:Uncharacterized protein n=2 Tax=Rhodonellum TaxID=336827 RepID=U5BWS8_9BACT|nr:hypothetical protein P872_20885 [Rhodonellum psychrophilum GCM71 = DSM 17998]SDZ23008.1 hypothetical protein SAMN05444412_10820 [Rhodonellum ikkaensis]